MHGQAGWPHSAHAALFMSSLKTKVGSTGKCNPWCFPWGHGCGCCNDLMHGYDVANADAGGSQGSARRARTAPRGELTLPHVLNR
jgi:hypothetical protein